MIFRVSILVVASVAAAFVVSPVNPEPSKKQNIILSEDSSSSREMDMEEEEEEEINEKLQFDRESMLGKRKMEHSRNQIKELEKRRVTLERKLFELYSRKEKLSSIAHLERSLDDKTAEIDKLNFRIYALKSEIKDLQETIRQGNLGMKQLGIAKKMIGEIQMKNGRGIQIKGKMVLLEGQLSGFTADERSARDALDRKKLDAVRSIELEAVKMKRINKEFELDKRELSIKLFAAHAKISALDDMTESKTIAKIRELRHANADLSKEVERLQNSRFDMVEQLVYQRWLNACLRAEIRDHKKSTRKAVQKELCKMTTQYPDMKSSSSSFTSSTESEDVDSSTIESSSSGQRRISGDSGVCHSTRCRSSMDGSSIVSSPDKLSIGSPLERTGVIRTNSTSMVPSKTPVPSTELYRISSTETLERSNLIKVRRVSFNDAVEIVPSADKALINFVERVFDNKDIVTLVSRQTSRMKSGLQSQSTLAVEKHEFPSSEVFLAKPDESSNLKRRSLDKDGLHSSVSNVIPNENKMDTHIMPTVFSFLILLFALLVCFLHVSARLN